MNLYLVKRTDDWGYDDYDGFVCSAESEEQALDMLPDDYGIKEPITSFDEYTRRFDWCPHGWVNSKDKLIAIRLGTSDFDAPKVHLSSYHAG